MKVWPYGSEAQQSWEKGIDILYELYKQYRERKLEKELAQFFSEFDLKRAA